MSFNLLAAGAEKPTEAPASPAKEEALFEVDVDKHDENGTNENPSEVDSPAREVGDAAKDTAEAGDSDSDAEDAEDWADISKGRYFGDPSDTSDAQRCHNCKGIGHKRKDCPHSLCRTCGALDDHDTVRCPLTQRCFNCARLGHLAIACPEPARQSGSHCKECGSRSHLARSCPQIWRLYHPDVQFNAESADWSVTPYCYNCADKGHYGDDCDLPHRTRLLEPSAFCMANEPESDRPRQKPHQKHKQRSEPASHAPSTNTFRRPQNGRGDGHHERRYEPYKRPEVISERYPRGMPGYGNSGRDRSKDRSRGSSRAHPYGQDRDYGRDRYDQSSHGRPQRGGKPYRGGMFSKHRRR